MTMFFRQLLLTTSLAVSSLSGTAQQKPQVGPARPKADTVSARLYHCKNPGYYYAVAAKDTFVIINKKPMGGVGGGAYRRQAFREGSKLVAGDSTQRFELSGPYKWEDVKLPKGAAGTFERHLTVKPLHDMPLHKIDVWRDNMDGPVTSQNPAVFADIEFVPHKKNTP